MDRRGVLATSVADALAVPLGASGAQEDDMALRIVVLLLTLVLPALTQSPGVSAQTGSKVYRLGWVSLFPAPTQLLPEFPELRSLKARLAERGYVEGKNVTFELRWADGDYRRVPELAAELERSGVDVILALGSRVARISQNVVRRAPLVVYTCDAFDHVARLAQQGGNVTGVTCMTSELSGKRLELLKEAVPRASRVVFLSEPEDSPSGLKRAQDAAPGLGIKLTTVGFKSRGELPRALEMVAKERPDALFVYPDPFTLMERERIAEFALIDMCISNRHYRHKKAGSSEAAIKDRRSAGRLRACWVIRHNAAMSSSTLSGRPLASVALKWVQTNSSGFRSGA